MAVNDIVYACAAGTEGRLEMARCKRARTTMAGATCGHHHAWGGTDLLWGTRGLLSNVWPASWCMVTSCTLCWSEVPSSRRQRLLSLVVSGEQSYEATTPNNPLHVPAHKTP